MTNKNAFILGLLVMILLNTSPELPNRNYLVDEIVFAKEIHEAYLELPESDTTGDWGWHSRWVDTYEAVIDELGVN